MSTTAPIRTYTSSGLSPPGTGRVPSKLSNGSVMPPPRVSWSEDGSMSASGELSLGRQQLARSQTSLPRGRPSPTRGAVTLAPLSTAGRGSPPLSSLAEQSEYSWSSNQPPRVQTAPSQGLGEPSLRRGMPQTTPNLLQLPGGLDAGEHGLFAATLVRARHGQTLGLDVELDDTQTSWVIKRVHPDSPAANVYAILPGDQLVAINGRPASVREDLANLVSPSVLFFQLTLRRPAPPDLPGPPAPAPPKTAPSRQPYVPSVDPEVAAGLTAESPSAALEASVTDDEFMLGNVCGDPI